LPSERALKCLIDSFFFLFVSFVGFSAIVSVANRRDGRQQK
jgi:hypothetical protein